MVRRVTRPKGRHVQVKGWLVLPTKFCRAAIVTAAEEQREESSIDKVNYGPNLRKEQKRELHEKIA